jgi:hypothetical protein
MSSSASHEAYAQTEGNNTDTLTHADPSTGMTFQYPSSWQIQDVNASMISNDTISAIRLIPSGQNNTGFVDNVIVSAIEVGNTTLDQYTSEALELYRNNLSGTVTITKSEPTTLAGNPAHMIIFQENFQGQQLMKMQVWTMIGDQLYLVTYGADESEFSQHAAGVEAIVNSLQVSNGAQVQRQQLQPGEQESVAPPFFKQ